MPKQVFGTDGVRGIANQKFTPELAFQVGLGAGRILGKGNVVVGRDTRRSGSMIESALSAGLTSAGVDVVSVGVAPTGSLSWLCRSQGFDLGFVISASHNPAPDNGIKLFCKEGKKASDEFEEQIEALFDSQFINRPTGPGIGVRTDDEDLLADYVEFLVSLVPEGLDGMKIALDCSHGAGYEIGPMVFERLGATLTTAGSSPDGLNINHGCGATHPSLIQDLTKTLGADIGIAFDGDADRAVFADSEGNLINGDRTMALWARHWKVHPAIVVGTVMSNGGFEQYLGENSIKLVRANVGDKYVSQAMSEHGARVGGEQSGHIIFSERGPTGDGLVTALELCRVLKQQGKSAAELYHEFENWPQILTNVNLDQMLGWDQDSGVIDAISTAESMLGAMGRVNVRASGTQPMLRIMVEAADVGNRDQASQHIVSEILRLRGGKIYSEVDLTHALGD